MQQLKQFSRERVAGLMIYLCLILVILSIIGVKLLDVRVVNIELVDDGLYTVITQNGPVNIEPNNILRIERTYTKAAVTGATIELDKIYTDKGFIYSSSTDSYAGITRQLMKSVDSFWLPTWERKNSTWQSVQPYSYAIGTPPHQIPLLFSLLSLQYIFLSMGGIALAFLIFPLRWKDQEEEKVHSQPGKSHEQDYHPDEQLSAVAK